MTIYLSIRIAARHGPTVNAGQAVHTAPQMKRTSLLGESPLYSAALGKVRSQPSMRRMASRMFSVELA